MGSFQDSDPWLKLKPLFRALLPIIISGAAGNVCSVLSHRVSSAIISAAKFRSVAFIWMSTTILRFHPINTFYQSWHDSGTLAVEDQQCPETLSVWCFSNTGVNEVSFYRPYRPICLDFSQSGIFINYLTIIVNGVEKFAFKLSDTVDLASSTFWNKK